MTGESNPISNEDIDDLSAEAQQKANVDAPSDAPSDADSESLKPGEIDALLAKPVTMTVGEIVFLVQALQNVEDPEKKKKTGPKAVPRSK